MKKGLKLIHNLGDQPPQEGVGTTDLMKKGLKPVSDIAQEATDSRLAPLT